MRLLSAAILLALLADQAAASDGWVTPAQVFGRVTSIERGEVHLNMDQPELRFLNRLAALRSRWPILRGKP